MDDKANVRVTRWLQRLLDLSLRNRLLNAKDSKQIIPLEAKSIADLEDRLSGDASVLIEAADAKSSTKNALRASLATADLQKRLKEIYRQAKADLEESGVNALYLALGFLSWQASGATAKTYRAPILLLPVSLSRKNVREGYQISALDEDELVNATLLEFLRVEFGITVEGLDPLPEDESGVDVPKVLEAFRLAIANREGWQVESVVALGNFSFGKFVMWKDLSSRTVQLAEHPLVGHLMRGGGHYDDGVPTFPPEEIAAHVQYGSLYTPLSADSSQLTAVLYSALGKSFVLHGPPGTGKSQTITNLIAQNLALGRKVLFVSEKKAALDVVYRRLTSIGFKPFCLELHSNKAGKGVVLEQFKEALDFVDQGVPNEWARTAAAIGRTCDELNVAVAALQKVQKNGLSAYDCLATKIAAGSAPLPALDVTACACSEQQVADWREAVVRMVRDWRETDPSAYKALDIVAHFDWNPTAEADCRRRLTALRGKSSFMRGLAVLFGGGGVLRRTADLGLFGGFRAEMSTRLDAALAALGASRDVMRYRASEHAASEKIGRHFAEALENGTLDSSAAGETFDQALAAKTLEEILSTEPALASFTGLRREEEILEFRRLDAAYAELVRHVVRARLAEKLPGGRLKDCPDGCELGIIRRECAKKTRQKPVRQLLAEARGIVGTLKPCFLMSPLSVAQYLPAEATFDLVVFDEASQIPVWDAIGVIARARQCVVVGDPKQMPPTNFFQKTDGGEDEDEAEDLESILDECLAAGLPSAHLNWHYRSRHESLIAFSNHNYYADRLCTFPSAKSPVTLGVAYRFVENGIYEAKASRTNRAEAEALVDYIFTCLAEPNRCRRSAGVVTFSMAQKNLIEDLLEERRAVDPRFEDYFSSEGEEPFFVKNLENVQGDERDVILFSVGYAKGVDGKFLMNFGPLNRAGGERRLNVAVTRAKEQIVVFASCKSTEIDLTRTQALGAAHLKEFLSYAERQGQRLSDEAATESSVDNFALSVAACLRKAGYSVEHHVGCSGYRIDLGVRSANAGRDFIAAVECDGASYQSALTTRDRDQLRASVLRSLGWNAIRVWAADWAFDRPRAEARLLKELEEIQRLGGGLLPEPTSKPTVTFPRRHISAEGDLPRTPLDQVPNDRIRAMMDAVEHDLGHCEIDTLYRETARRFGYKTLSPKARERLQGIRR